MVCDEARNLWQEATRWFEKLIPGSDDFEEVHRQYKDAFNRYEDHKESCEKCSQIEND